MWERQFCNMEMTQCVLVFVIAFLYMIEAVPICPEYKFYDHGTDHCEECREICDKAEFMGTVDMCWKNCPAYARIIWPPKEPEIPAPTAYPSRDPPRSQPNIGEIAGYLVGTVGVLSIVIAAFFAYKKRRIIMDKLQRGRRRRDGDVDENQQGQEMILLDPNNLERRGDGEEERGAGEGSLAATGVSTSTSGVQEQGEVVGSPNGEMPFYRIPTGAKYVPPPSPQQPASVNDCKYPTQESVSQQGTTALAAANDQFNLSEIPAVQVQMSDLQMPPSLHEDLHSTELKTFEPSLSHSTTFTGAGAMDDMPSTKI